MNTNPSNAIIIGGSIAGLLAARVLSDHFDHITVIERDRLPDEGAYRSGVPQARHLHTLLIRGQRIMDNLFPGFTNDLVEAGAPAAVWGRDNRFYTSGGWTQVFDSGLISNVCSRAELEWLVRRRVYAISTIQFLTERDVLGLIANDNHSVVTGVQIESRIDHSTETLFADLVVDASGRSSKTPEWLAELGYQRPAETVINAHNGYATRWYERPQGEFPLAVGIQPRPAEKNYRGGAVLEVEGGRWAVTLLGANADYPPTTEAEFMDYAKSLPSPAIYNMIKDAKPISAIVGYRRLENRQRHYERMARRPENFIVMGDAACALNPIYGQGMTKAALEAEALGQMMSKWLPLALRERGLSGEGLVGFAAAFQKRSAKIASEPWLMAASEDLRYPNVEGSKPDLTIRFSQKYFDLVARAMPYDNAVTTSFFESMTLLRPPTSMMRPAILVRVLRHALFGHHATRNNPTLATGEWSTVGS
ncbi:MAG: FAD-dependent monooxygenase [Chloroflexota bacterium]